MHRGHRPWPADRRRIAPEPKAKTSENVKKGLVGRAAELNGLPEKLETLETKRDQAGERLGDPSLYKDAPEEAARSEVIQDLEAEIAEAYARWEALEARVVVAHVHRIVVAQPKPGSVRG